MNKLEALKCVEVTSQRQADNGTICYHDPITNCDYLSYESGYIRRSYKLASWRTGKMMETIYQLNPQRKVDWVSPYNGQVFKVTERVLIEDAQERLNLLARAVANYRQTWKTYINNKIIKQDAI